MSHFQHFIGIDPGPTPGFVLLTPRAGGRHLDIDVLQCTARLAPSVLGMLLDDWRQSLGSARALVAIERFVVGRGSMRSGSAGATTRDLVGQLEREADHRDGVSVLQRSAGLVKPWATDDRLARVGLLEPTKGMRHSRDAARHALYAAVKDGTLLDPLSNRKAPR